MRLIIRENDAKGLLGEGHLILGVDYEGPAASTGHQDAVLGGHDVAGQTVSVPLPNLVRVAQDSDQTEVGADGDPQLLTA